MTSHNFETGTKFKVGWLSRALTLRRYSRRLAILTFLIRRGLLVDVLRIHKTSPESIVRLTPRFQSLSRLILRQMDLMDEYAALPFVRGSRAKPTLRIANVARNFLDSFQCDVSMNMDHYHAHLLDLGYELLYGEIRLAFPAIQLACLMNIYESLFGPGKWERGPVRQINKSFQVLDSLDSVSEEEFIRSLTPYESILERDPAHTYPSLEAHSKDIYRVAVDRLAREHGVEPNNIVRKALELSVQAHSSQPDSPAATGHIGFYLVDDGVGFLVAQLEQDSDESRSSGRSPIRRRFRLYVYSILLTAVFLSATSIALFRTPQLSGVLRVVVAAAIVLISWETANRVVDDLLALWVKPNHRPQIDYGGGIPDSCKTIVAVPTMLVDVSHISSTIDLCERNYLNTKDRNVLFAVLTDYMDSSSGPPTSEEQYLLDFCSDAVQGLNAKYGSTSKGPFYLFHRARQYSAGQNKWIGWERKRGKLRQLNKFLITGENHFELIVGDLTALTGARFVAVLDDNTELPRLGIATLAGILSHPLNEPVVDRASEKLSRGYAILQPFPCVSARSTTGWYFAEAVFGNIFNEDNAPVEGRCVQFDLFNDCVFLGKGLYDVRVIEQQLADHVPLDTILSHDIIEGGYVRTGFVGHVFFGESCPSTLGLHYQRLHRWARGDWQNLAMMLRGQGRRLSTVAKYTVLTFARRAVLPAMRSLLILAVICGDRQFASGRFLVYWFLVGLPEYLNVVAWASIFWGKGQFIHRSRYLLHSLYVAFTRHALMLVTALHQGLVMLDALARTSYRLVKRRRLLSWSAASYLERQAKPVYLMGLYAIVTFVASALILASQLFVVERSLVNIGVPVLWCSNLWLYYVLGAPRRPATTNSPALRNSRLQNTNGMAVTASERLRNRNKEL